MSAGPLDAPQGIRALVRNSGVLLSGVVIAQILGAATLAVTARSLGARSLGVLALVQSYVQIVDSIVKFQSWQAIIRYGSIQLTTLERLSRLVKFGFSLDLATAIAGAVLAPLILWELVSIFDWPQETLGLGAIATLVILFDWAGTATGVLRLTGDFSIMSAVRIGMAAIRFGGAVAVWQRGGGIYAFMGVWAIGSAAETVTLAVLARRALFGLGAPALRTVTLQGVRTENPGIWGFVIATNLTTTLRLVTSQIDVFIVAAFTGASGAGVFRVAKGASQLLGKLSEPLYHAVYPQLARLWTNRDFVGFRRMVLLPSLSAGATAVCAFILMIVCGRPALIAVFGDEFASAYPVVVWQIAALTIAIFTISLHPALLAMGLARTSLYIQSAVTTVYLTVLAVLTARVGVVGAGMASTCYSIAFAALATLALWTRFNKARDEDKVAQSASATALADGASNGGLGSSGSGMGV